MESRAGATRVVDRQRRMGDRRSPTRRVADGDEPSGRAHDGMVGGAATVGEAAADARSDGGIVRDPASGGREGAWRYSSAARDVSAGEVVDGRELEQQQLVDLGLGG